MNPNDELNTARGICIALAICLCIYLAIFLIVRLA